MGMRWTGHVARYEITEIHTYNMLVRDIGGNKPLGIPRLRYGIMLK
jgi:hypothetical protein